MAKYITTKQVLEMVKSNDNIIVAEGPMEPQEFLSNLHTIAGKVNNVSIGMVLSMRGYPFQEDEASAKSFSINGYFMTGALRKAAKMGNVQYVPNHLRNMGEVMAYGNHINIFVGGASMPSKDGKLSLSLCNVYEKYIMERADVVILEVNPNFPYIKGDVEITIDDADYIVETNYPLCEWPEPEPTDKDRLIGSYIAPHIKDGCCLQIGIGGIPNALTEVLKEKKDLGIHTELLTTGVIKLAKAGVINCSKKQNHPGKITTSIVMGSKELYDFATTTGMVEVYAASYCNNTETIRQNDNHISVNTSLEVDLSGQCCSESIGTRIFSGTGGQSDTAIGAQKSKGGKSFICLYSTTTVTNANGEKEEISKIVPSIKPGAAISLSRNDVNFVVTEYGAVDLKGRNVKQRAELLISIAHPKFRDELRKQAKEMNIL